MNKFRYHRASIGMTKMTMTKNNSAAAEIAPPNCHVAVVPQSNCAVDVRTSRFQKPSDSPNISDISPFLPIFRAVFPECCSEKKSISVCILPSNLTRTRCRVALLFHLSSIHLPPPLLPLPRARQPTPFPRAKTERRARRCRSGH